MADDDRVFKALADPTRRFLLDQLFERDGRTLTDLESALEMTRFGVMKHLRVLEEAGLVDPQTAAEPVTTVADEIKPGAHGVCSLTLTHELQGAAHLAAVVGGVYEEQGAGGGHAWILSDLKTLLETGRSFGE